MKMDPRARRIGLYQNLGFLGMTFSCVVDELVQSPPWNLAVHPFALIFRWPTLELLLTLTVWFLVRISTRRILDHLHYLENFLRVCAWCRRINYQGEWMRLEEFMQQGFDTPTTHGICPECFRQQVAAAKKARAAEEEAPKSG